MSLSQIYPMEKQKKQIIDIKNTEQIEFWRKRFGVSIQRLKDAVSNSSGDPEDVGNWIKHNYRHGKYLKEN
jgi:hypothetical protein